MGDVQFRPQENENERELTLRNVYHVSGMKKNLLSISQLTTDGNYVVLDPENVNVYAHFETSSQPIAQGHRSNSLYVMSAETAYIDKTKRNKNVDLWHMRLSHVSYDKLDDDERKLVSGLPQLEVCKDLVAGCQYGKAHPLPYEKSVYKAKEQLELVHSDVFGPVKQPSASGMKYMVTFIYYFQGVFGSTS